MYWSKDAAKIFCKHGTSRHQVAQSLFIRSVIPYKLAANKILALLAFIRDK